MMKISILVPVYGVSKYIETCAVSLFEQTYQELEYVFVDDCTPDDSMEILLRVLERYPHRKAQVRILRHDHNRGLGAARSTGVAAATGEYLFFADSDDSLATDAIEKLVARQQQTNADIVDGTIRLIHDDGSLGEKLPLLEYDTQTMLRLMLAQNTVSHNIWGRLIRHDLLTVNNIDFVEGVNMAEDYCTMTRLMYAATSRACLNDIVYYYRATDTGAFEGWYKKHHLCSVLSANRVVGEFLAERDKNHTFAYPYELGVLNVFHRSLKTLPRNEVLAVCPYRPTHLIFRCCKALFVHQATRPLLRLAYLVIKHFYVKSAISQSLNPSISQ